MDAIVADWLNLILRWAHVITGIAWIGSSFFFNWLDSHIEKPKEPNAKIEGDLWMVHSGGFYNMVKIDLAPDELPETLHWVKWEAGFTWITGALLLAVMFWLGASVYTMPATPTGLGIGGTVAIAIAVIVCGWLVYDCLWNSSFAEKSPWAATAVSFVLIVGVAFGLGQIMSGRAAYIHVGALMGTLMAANVWMRIIPSQRELVAATRERRRPDPKPAIRAKTRSLHNNYMTLPVVLIMFSGHYAGTYGHTYNWLILALLILVGAAVRHIFNLRNKGRERSGYVYLGAAALGMLALLAIWTGGAPSRYGNGPPIVFAEVQAVIARRCVMCHSANPTMDGFDAAPKGVMYDTPDQIRVRARDIALQAVDSDIMPPGNITEMTDEERAVLGRWVAQGATVE